MFVKKPLRNLLSHSHTQKRSYVNIYMKWTKEHFYDNIEHIHKARALKPVLALKNWITQSPEKCIPLDSVDKKRLRFEVPVEMPIFLRRYPTIFEEFRTPKYNHPWFRLTPEAAEVDEEEQRVYEDFKEDLRERLRRLILMSPEKVLPLKIVQGMKWYLGLPDDILSDPERKFLDGSFRFVGMGDGIDGLGVSSEGQATLSYIQRNAIRKGLCSGSEGSGTTSEEVIVFPLFPTKGIRLRKRIKDWLNEFQKLPYLSPYKDYPDLATDTDLSEKRVIAILHELLCLCVHHSAERQKILCLRKYLGLPQKFLKAFERHPFMFYVSTRHRTRTAILKEPFEDPSSIERHPLLSVRRKYTRLMKYSAERVENRRFRAQTPTRRRWKKSKVAAMEESPISGKFRVQRGVL